MTKKKAARKSTARKKQMTPASVSPLEQHAEHIRQVVHSALTNAGIHDLSLQSIQFAPIPDCPSGQHAEKTCSRDADGTVVCTWHCVPN